MFPYYPHAQVGAFTGSYPTTGQFLESPTVVNLRQAIATLQAMLPAYESQAMALRGMPQGLHFQHIVQQIRLQLQGLQAQLAQLTVQPPPPPPEEVEGLLRRAQTVLQQAAAGTTPSSSELRILADQVRSAGYPDLAAQLEALLVKANQFCGVFFTGDPQPLMALGVSGRAFPRNAVVTAPVWRARVEAARRMGLSAAVVASLENFARTAPASTNDLKTGQVVRINLRGAEPIEVPPQMARQEYADILVVAPVFCGG